MTDFGSRNSEKLRLRFCPSPTGVPHVGMIRTMLFNWAYTKHIDGTLVFRIEDTDQERDSEESYQAILESLRWLGLDWDEGVEAGGPYGPYRQSERMDIYREVAGQLLEAGFTYKSYSTTEEIRARNMTKGLNPNLGYDGFDRELTSQQISQYEAEGRKPVLRIRVPDQLWTFQDLIRGEITFNPQDFPDFVIMRGDNTPLYTLTNPLDDALMKIDLVMRGEDLLSSTPRQMVLYEALKSIGVATKTPDFAHLPYVMGEGNKKLSKRDLESDVLLHRNNGMIPEGLLNYLALLGWSIGPDRDVFSMSEMIKEFDIAKVNPNPARFDYKKCVALNGVHIRELEVSDFKQRIVPYLYGDGLVSSDNFAQLPASEKTILDQAAGLLQERIQLLGEAPAMLDYLFRSSDALEYQADALNQLPEGWEKILQIGIDTIEQIPNFTATALHEIFNEVLVQGQGLKPKYAFTPFRVALTGKRISLPLFETMVILGREVTLQRLSQFVQKNSRA
ncbi:MAG: glutamate--tRNA ligase [Bifidobacteriaceae bacterium]|nr:glutamate--tRNA ligase [Bifidobacteriaceae bacterium]